MVGNRTHLLYNFYVFFQNSHKMITFLPLSYPQFTKCKETDEQIHLKIFHRFK